MKIVKESSQKKKYTDQNRMKRRQEINLMGHK
jgi:hypothetical protein